MTDLCLKDLIPNSFEQELQQIRQNPDLPAAGRKLRKAAEVIEKFGWNRGSYGNKLHGYCVMGALTYDPSMAIRNWDLEAWNAHYALHNWLKQSFPDHEFAGVEAWNDRYLTSKEDALSYLRKAADDLDPQTW